MALPSSALLEGRPRTENRLCSENPALRVTSRSSGWFEDPESARQAR